VTTATAAPIGRLRRPQRACGCDKTCWHTIPLPSVPATAQQLPSPWETVDHGDDAA
jgi:hypothetical protein